MLRKIQNTDEIEHHYSQFNLSLQEDALFFQTNNRESNKFLKIEKQDNQKPFIDEINFHEVFKIHSGRKYTMFQEGDNSGMKQVQEIENDDSPFDQKQNIKLCDMLNQQDLNNFNTVLKFQTDGDCQFNQHENQSISRYIQKVQWQDQNFHNHNYFKDQKYQKCDVFFQSIIKIQEKEQEQIQPTVETFFKICGEGQTLLKIEQDIKDDESIKQNINSKSEKEKLIQKEQQKVSQAVLKFCLLQKIRKLKKTFEERYIRNIKNINKVKKPQKNKNLNKSIFKRNKFSLGQKNQEQKQKITSKTKHITKEKRFNNQFTKKNAIIFKRIIDISEYKKGDSQDNYLWIPKRYDWFLHKQKDTSLTKKKHRSLIKAIQQKIQESQNNLKKIIHQKQRQSKIQQDKKKYQTYIPYLLKLKKCLIILYQSPSYWQLALKTLYESKGAKFEKSLKLFQSQRKQLENIYGKRQTVNNLRMFK